MASKNRITISLSDSQYSEISRLAAEGGMSRSKLLVQIFDQFLATRSRDFVVNPNASLSPIKRKRTAGIDSYSGFGSETELSAYKDRSKK